MVSQSVLDGVPARITVRISGRNRLLCEALVRLLRKRAGFCVQATLPGVKAERESDKGGPCDVLLADSLDVCRTARLHTQPTEEQPFSNLLLFGMDDSPEQFIDAVRLG